MSSINKNKYLTFSILLSFLALTANFYAKYHFNSLSYSEFNINNVGNILNLSLSIFLFLGLICHYFVKKQISIWFYRFNTFMLFLAFGVVVVLIILNFINFEYPNEYIKFYTFKKIFTGGMFFASVLLQLFVALQMWGTLFSTSRIIPIKSIVLTILFIAFGIMATLYFSISFDPELEINSINKEEKVIGVVLGAAVWQKNKPSPLFKGRIEKAKELYDKGLISRIQLTGGNAPGEISEARAAFIYLDSLGVNNKNIIIEEKTATTSEQILYIKNHLSNKNYSIIVISDHFHIKRVMEMCKFYGVKAVGITSDYSLNWEKLVYYRVRDSIGLLLFWLFAI